MGQPAATLAESCALVSKIRRRARDGIGQSMCHQHPSSSRYVDGAPKEKGGEWISDQLAPSVVGVRVQAAADRTCARTKPARFTVKKADTTSRSHRRSTCGYRAGFRCRRRSLECIAGHAPETTREPFSNVLMTLATRPERYWHLVQTHLDLL